MNRVRRCAGPLCFCLTTLVVGLFAACGKTPAGPTPPPPPPVITAPVITALNVATTRTEVNRDVEVTAVVEDAEKPVEALTYVWSATAGTFTGAGRTVTWRLGKGERQTPLDVVISVTVVEPYQVVENNALVNREHRITREATAFRVHDSTDEISRMAVHFLVDLFGDSSKSADQCLVDFWPACQGTEAERRDIIENRQTRLITSVEARVDRVTFNGEMTVADAVVPCTFRDIQLSTNQAFVASGTCTLNATYHDARWWLCSSEFVDYTFGPAGASRSRRPVSSYWRSSVPQE